MHNCQSKAVTQVHHSQTFWLMLTSWRLLLPVGALTVARGFIPAATISFLPQHISTTSCRATHSTTMATDLPSRATLDSILAVAVKAARRAGKLMVENSGAEIVKTKFNPKDLLTKVDGMAQDAIEEEVKAAFDGQGHGFLGEESVAPGAAASAEALSKILAEGKNDYLWIVDPIDGTTNFCHAMPLSAVSIGVAYRGVGVVAAIYDPYADEMFTATANGGAFLNSKRIHVGDQGTLAEALVAGGAPPGALALGPCMRGIVALAPRARSMRMLGSAAIMLAWVACGRLTSYFEPDLNCWDVCAGALLITEAGGTMSHCDGSPYSLTTRSILGSNGGRVHTEIVEVLVAAQATELDTEPRI